MAHVQLREEFIGLDDATKHFHVTCCGACRVSTSHASVQCLVKRSRYRRPKKSVDLDLQVDWSSSKTNVADRSSSTVENAPSVDVSANSSFANSTTSISSRCTVLQCQGNVRGLTGCYERTIFIMMPRQNFTCFSPLYIFY
ncbi:hypothetical protein BT93_J1149 [Corymbia citriodora subsp. variegata]|nr:hypothetical protein BT93_J1149 [Corymbia citriodora subsp. variegata]KAF8010430.1 hypothetical protein BT93_J1149 [Corymbia citriodora subsp. variegata]